MIWPLLTFALALPTAAALADLLTGGHVFGLPPVATIGLVALVGIGAHKTNLLGQEEE